MKKSETIALVSVAVGAGVALSLWHWVTFLPGWADAMIGVIAAASVFKESLRIQADKSVVDSKAINKS
jgi:hypothetical protein